MQDYELNVMPYFHSKSMKHNYVISLSLLLIVPLTVSACSQKSAPKELLVVWGQEKFDDNYCSVQVVDPDMQTTGSVLQVEAPCYFYTFESEGVTKLAQFRDYSNEIKVFGITPQLSLEVEQVLELKDVSMTSLPIWAEDGVIYVSGIWQEREQILRVDSQTGEVSPFIVNEEGIATAPSLSPDGKYLLYVTFADKMTTGQCQLDCYSQLRLFNMETGADVSLSSIIEPAMVNPTFTQCGGWSPTENYLSFTIGCYSSESPNQIIVLDVETNQVVADIRPVVDDTNVAEIGWFSDQELLFSRPKLVEGENIWLSRYYVYSLETGLTTEAVKLPDFHSDGTTFFELLDSDWTESKDFIVGISGRNAEGNSPLIVIKVDSEPVQINMLETESFNTYPLWSASGNWIAYQTADEVFALDTDVKVTNREGGVSVNTGLNDMPGELLGYMWLSQ